MKMFGEYLSQLLKQYNYKDKPEFFLIENWQQIVSQIDNAQFRALLLKSKCFSFEDAVLKISGLGSNERLIIEMNAKNIIEDICVIFDRVYKNRFGTTNAQVKLHIKKIKTYM